MAPGTQKRALNQLPFHQSIRKKKPNDKKFPLHTEGTSPTGPQSSESDGIKSKCCNSCYMNQGESPHHHLVAITGKHLPMHHVRTILEHKICTWEDIMSFPGPLLMITGVLD